ncbi:MAG: NADPH-dependent FMN reductase [Prosthecobacter sp.]|uniref:NADPH-dependent FMN reductase n=1 Tax=Prosthecobacter sp. TaxID=1965333 RepID=UPI003902FCF1
MKPLITIISGTNRPDSNTRKVAGLVQTLHTSAGAATCMLDLQELPAECFSPDGYARKPAEFQRQFADVVLESDGLVIVTPEYNGSFPGVLKYFIDLLKFPESFERRPVCFVGLAAGDWGALRAVEQLQMIFGYRNAHIFPQRVFMPAVDDLLDEDGGHIMDAAMRERLEAQALGFQSFVLQLRARKNPTNAGDA